MALIRHTSIAACAIAGGRGCGGTPRGINLCTPKVQESASQNARDPHTARTRRIRGF